MITSQFTIALVIFLAVIIFVLWRPKGINEAIPAAIGALMLYILGIVSFIDMKYVFDTVAGASITIIATMAMSIVLESMGFFRWAAFNLVLKCKGSGILLYWCVILLCFLTTMFFNNDGSIVITTPIIIQIVKALELKPRQQLPYLLSGALIATASSAPIGVSNLANLIALKIVGVDLITHPKFMFVPSMLGLITISILLFLYFRKDIPERIAFFPRACMKLYEKNINDPSFRPLLGKPLPTAKHPHPPIGKHPLPPPIGKPVKEPSNHKSDSATVDWYMFKLYMTIIILVRVCLFIFSYYGIAIEGIAAFGALLIILIRWYSQDIGPIDVLRKTPWHVFIFAFGMYLVVYGLHNVKFTDLIVDLLKGPVSAHLYSAVLIIGTLVTLMSSLFNNHPSIMLGTISITQMGLEQQYLQVAYLAIILGSDIGSLILPSGTLASLIWMFILRKNDIPITWRQYITATIRIIPIGLLVSLVSLYFWVLLLS